MRVVYVAHPLSAPTPEGRQVNLAAASRWVAWAARQGVAPVADWITLASQWTEEDRELGLTIDEELVSRCDEVWLCGRYISNGMRREMGAAVRAGKLVVDLTCVDLTLTAGAPPADDDPCYLNMQGALIDEIERARSMGPRGMGPEWWRDVDRCSAGTIFEDDKRPQYASQRCGTCSAWATKCRCAATGVGTKFDGDKVRYDLVDPGALRALASILTHGAKKYAPNNWRKVEGWRDRYYAALVRHLEAWRGGEQLDPDSGEAHLAHALCNAHFLAALDAAKEDAAPRGEP